MSSRQLYRVGLVLVGALALSSCAQDVPPHLKPISAEAMHLLGERGMSAQSPIFVRIFKADSELEVWKQRADGRFYHFKTYPICNWSGDLGPKLRQGDKQAPEGFYTVRRGQMNPNSSFHLSFNLGYPNRYDRAHNRTGDFLMVHGDCRSAGCYAMTDSLIEEIYALAREAFAGGQERFHVHAYPFRMTEENMKLYDDERWRAFWGQLKEGYDQFELTRTPPAVAVCGRRYLVNTQFLNRIGRVDPAGPCPVYQRVEVEPFTPVSQAALAEPVVVPGRKNRNIAAERGLSGSGRLASRRRRSGQRMGLTSGGLSVGRWLKLGPGRDDRSSRWIGRAFSPQDQ